MVVDQDSSAGDLVSERLGYPRFPIKSVATVLILVYYFPRLHRVCSNGGNSNDTRISVSMSFLPVLV